MVKTQRGNCCCFLCYWVSRCCLCGGLLGKRMGLRSGEVCHRDNPATGLLLISFKSSKVSFSIKNTVLLLVKGRYMGTYIQILFHQIMFFGWIKCSFGLTSSKHCSNMLCFFLRNASNTALNGLYRHQDEIQNYCPLQTWETGCSFKP